MGGLDFTALPVISEMLGITDIDLFIIQLVAIRDHMKAQQNE